jgi:AcrR family transcriptional regulator
MNMFTENVKPRKRAVRQVQPRRAPARDRLYATATRLIAARGYEATTLRDIAKKAGVSVGLLYRYFPGKQAVVIALYDELSSKYAQQAAGMPPGRWRDRFLFALKTSLVLEPHNGAQARRPSWWRPEEYSLPKRRSPAFASSGCSSRSSPSRAMHRSNH